MSQPAATQAVASVEAALGAPLLERRPTGLQPRAAGLAAAARIGRAIAILREAVEGIGPRADSRRPADPLRGITAAQLVALIGVAEQGGFAQAAHRAGLARATVHRAVRQLERSLRTPLFETTSFGVRPTREAEKLALQAQLAFAEFTQVRAELAAAAGTGSGSTVIGTMPLARSVLVPRAVLEFTQQRPEHAVSILDGPYQSLLAALRRGAADLLIGALRDPAPAEDVVQEHLFDDPLAIVLRAGHPLAAEPAPTVAALSAFPWIAPRTESPLRRHFDRLFRSLGEPAVAPIECGSLDAARAILLASDRVMLLSAHQIHNELATGQLVALPHPLGAVSRAIGLTVRRKWHPTEVQTQLLVTLRRHARAFAAPTGTSRGAVSE